MQQKISWRVVFTFFVAYVTVISPWRHVDKKANRQSSQPRLDKPIRSTFSDRWRPYGNYWNSWSGHNSFSNAEQYSFRTVARILLPGLFDRGWKGWKSKEEILPVLHSSRIAVNFSAWTFPITSGIPCGFVSPKTGCLNWPRSEEFIVSICDVIEFCGK